jgi:hypothetical protein
LLHYSAATNHNIGFPVGGKQPELHQTVSVPFPRWLQPTFSVGNWSIRTKLYITFDIPFAIDPVLITEVIVVLIKGGPFKDHQNPMLGHDRGSAVQIAVEADDDDDREVAATKVQAAFRGYKERKEISEQRGAAPLVSRE